MKRLLLLLAGMTLLPGTLMVLAQDPPKRPMAIAALDPLLGTFEGDVTMMQDGKSIKGRAQHNNSGISSGWGFLMEEDITMEDGSKYTSHNIIGYDAGGKKVHVFSVTNAGETHDHKGVWKDAKTITLEYDGTWEGKPYVEKAVLTIDGRDSYTLTWKATRAGQIVSSGEEKLRRVGGSY